MSVGEGGARKPGPTRPASASELVSQVQRSRMVAAMLDVAGARGAANVTVGDVVSRAGVSRRTFYELFTGAEDCLLAAIDDALACARRYVSEAYDPDAPWLDRMRSGLQAFLAFLDDEPSMGRLLVVDSLGAGPRALARRAVALAPVIEQVDSGRDGRDGAGLSSLTAEGVVGAVLSVLHARLVEGREDAFLELSSALMSMIVRPYLGPAAARRELDRPIPTRERKASSPAGIDHLSELPMRLTYRTVRVLCAIAEQPGASNRQIGTAAGVEDQGQISKLLRRLQGLGLIDNEGAGQAKGAPNAWTLTQRGIDVHGAISASGDGGE